MFTKRKRTLVEYAIPDLLDKRFILMLRHVENQQLDRQKVIRLSVHLVELSRHDHEPTSSPKVNRNTYFCDAEQPPFKQLYLLPQIRVGRLGLKARRQCVEYLKLHLRNVQFLLQVSQEGNSRLMFTTRRHRMGLCIADSECQVLYPLG